MPARQVSQGRPSPCGRAGPSLRTAGGTGGHAAAAWEVHRAQRHLETRWLHPCAKRREVGGADAEARLRPTWHGYGRSGAAADAETRPSHPATRGVRRSAPTGGTARRPPVSCSHGRDPAGSRGQPETPRGRDGSRSHGHADRSWRSGCAPSRVAGSGARRSAAVMRPALRPRESWPTSRWPKMARTVGTLQRRLERAAPRGERRSVRRLRHLRRRSPPAPR